MNPILTKEQKEDIDLSKDPLYVKIKLALKKQFGFEPKLSDIKWGYYNALCLQYLKEEKWGLYRNTIFNMAKQLQKEGKSEFALQRYFEVLWFDIQGVTNVPLNLNNEFSMYNEKLSFIAPGVIYEVKKLITIVNKDHKKLFLNWINTAIPLKDAPLSNEQVWKRIEVELKK